MNYGIPYKGSKNRIAERIIEHLPSATHFYDVFGGGGAITHCAILSGKYKYVHYNELDPLVYRAFCMSINGEFKNENRWISREDFDRLKDTDPYVAICFSFGNDLKTYCYSQEKEPFKKAVHDFLFFNDKTEIEKFIPVNDCIFSSDDISIKRLEFQRYVKKYKKQIGLYYNTDKNNVIVHGNNLERLQSLETLERLYNLRITKNLDCTNKSYDDLDFEDDSVIYCDPPYKDTNTYRTNFNHEKFYEWCKKQKNIYISEYNMPNDFKILKTIDKVCSLSLTNNTETCEKLFTNNSQSITNALEW